VTPPPSHAFYDSGALALAIVLVVAACAGAAFLSGFVAARLRPFRPNEPHPPIPSPITDDGPSR
jgi:hypothetical protein